jgi:hypothetical protein
MDGLLGELYVLDRLGVSGYVVAAAADAGFGAAYPLGVGDEFVLPPLSGFAAPVCDARCELLVGVLGQEPDEVGTDAAGDAACGVDTDPELSVRVAHGWGCSFGLSWSARAVRLAAMSCWERG